jgi:catechol 2,3-dioxygenase-like lactoylglutathione lyase family enzyme
MVLSEHGGQALAVKQKTRSSRNAAGLSFNHAMVYVREMAPALHFYADLLGLKVLEEFKWQERTVYARLRAPRGEGTVALHLAEPGKPVDSSGVRLYFEVKALEPFCQKLEAAGIVLSQPPKVMPWGWKHAYVNDPDGHEVSLYWAGAKRFQKTAMAKPKPAAAR